VHSKRYSAATVTEQRTGVFHFLSSNAISQIKTVISSPGLST
jgi:hypothetical protein